MTAAKIACLVATTVLLAGLSMTVRPAYAQAPDLGRRVYEKANCVGCHKWHGGGGGGYGGAALSLRETALERGELIEVIRCGRPATRMPYHDRKAYPAPLLWRYDQGRPRRRLPPKRRLSCAPRRSRPSPTTWSKSPGQGRAHVRGLRRVLGRGYQGVRGDALSEKQGRTGAFRPAQGIATVQSANTNSIEPGSIFSSPSVLSTNHFGQAPPSPTSSAVLLAADTVGDRRALILAPVSKRHNSSRVLASSATNSPDGCPVKNTVRRRSSGCRRASGTWSRAWRRSRPTWRRSRSRCR